MKSPLYIRHLLQGSMGLMLLLASCLSPEKETRTILFFGDSITQAGKYIDSLQAWANTTSKWQGITFINAGLRSETVTGLTEPGHPGPRPYLFDRMDSLMAHYQPDEVYFCYGINCGIYQPFSQEIFEAYQKGIGRAVPASLEKGCKVTLLTPPPLLLDEKRKAVLLQEPPLHYNWKQPYPLYEQEVLSRFRRYLFSLASDEIAVIDIHSNLRLERGKSYGSDPIHPNAYGHRIIAQAIWDAWK